MTARRPRVLLLTSFQPEGHYSQGLAHSLWDAGCDELVVCTGRQEPAHADTRVARTWGAGVTFARDVVRFTDARRPDLMHIQHEFTMFGGGLSALQVPWLCRAVRRRGIALVVTVHAVPAAQEIDHEFVRAFTGSNRIPAPILRLGIRRILRGIAQSTDVTILHTSGLRDRFIADYEATPDRCRVLPLGVPTPPDGLNASPPLGEFRIVCPGYVSRRKGLETVVGGFARFARKHADARLVFAGGVQHPAYRDELLARAAAGRVADRVRFTDRLPYVTYMRELAQAHVVVLGAAFSVSASQPLAQAQAVSRPIIAPGSGTFRETLTARTDGLFYPPGDANDLSDRLSALHDSPDLRRTLEDGSRRAAERRSWPRVARDTQRMYAELAVVWASA